MIETVTIERTTYNRLPYKFEAGTPDIAGAVGLGAAIDYLDSIDPDALHAYEARVMAYARARLANSKVCASSATHVRIPASYRFCSTADIRRTSARCSISNRLPFVPDTIARCR